MTASSCSGTSHTAFLRALALVLLLAAGTRVEAAGLEAGFALADITPPAGWRCAGSFDEIISTGAHDPLHAKAIVLRETTGGTTVEAAIVVCDLCSVGRDASASARRLASERTGILAENIAICATHTHGGPEHYGTLRDLFHDRAVAEGGSDPHEPIDYEALLVESCARAIAEAHSKLAPVRIEAGLARQEGLAFNRRYRMRDGTVRFNPGKLNPDIAAPAGPIDPDLPIVLFRGAGGEPRGLFTSFAMHVAVWPMGNFSADFPGVLQTSLRETLGDGFVSIFAEGCAGDVNHFDVSSDRPQSTPEESERIGGVLARTVLAKLPELRAVEAPSLAVRSRTISMPLQEITDEAIALARDVFAGKVAKEPAFLLKVEAWKVLNTKRYRDRFGDAYPLEVQAVRLGKDVAIVLLPHEVFVELGLAVKKASPFTTTIVATLANDMDFYVPTRKAFAEGSYEVTTSSMKPGGGEMMVEAAVELLRELAAAGAPDISHVPGVVVDHIPAASRRYIGSPSIAVAGDGAYVVSHDVFGPGSTNDETSVFASRDRGKTWERIARVRGQWWSTLFAHGDALHLLGTSRENGACVIRRSRDGGRTWTEPKDSTSGLLFGEGKYHCAPVPVLVHGGRIWRGMEDSMGPGGWGSHFHAFVMSAPEGADLLRAASWTATSRIGGAPAWLGGTFGGWLEGNAVATPEGDVADVLRVDSPDPVERAAIVRVSRDGTSVSFDPAHDFVEMPGGAKKFTIRFDPVSRRYWSLVNHVPPEHRGGRPSRARNTLAVASSADLRAWTVHAIVLQHADLERHGFQYADWLFDGDDLIAVVRTAFDDGLGGAHDQHDANFLTFHRLGAFRRLER